MAVWNMPVTYWKKLLEVLLPQGFWIKYPEHFSPGRSASL
jgi:hypothetical protein